MFVTLNMLFMRMLLATYEPVNATAALLKWRNALAMVQAVIAVACCKWGDLKTFQQHQAVVQQQDQARQLMQSCNAKRRCMKRDMQWLCEETDYREREGGVGCHFYLLPMMSAATSFLFLLYCLTK